MNRKSPHILNTSANLLGFTFIVLSSIKGFGIPQAGIIDELTAACVALFAVSCAVSFASMQSTSDKRGKYLELSAEYIFFTGLLIVTAISLLLAFDIIKLSN